MAVDHRFLIASSLARLIHKERGPADRLIEAHFPARSDRGQLVRVERGRSYLILRSRGEDGQVREEQVEVPLSHAEALVEVAAGTVAFDRTPLPLGSGIEAVLDRFIMPRGLDLLTVTAGSDPHAFAPLPWFGTEVTGDAAYETSALALQGMPHFEEVEVSNAALEALLDTLDRTGAWYRSGPVQSVNQADEQFATAHPSAASSGRGDDAAPAAQATMAPAGGAPVVGPAEEAQPPRGGDIQAVAAEADQQEPSPGLPDVEAGPSLDPNETTTQRHPMFRSNIRELDDGMARLARSLAPRGPRSSP